MIKNFKKKILQISCLSILIFSIDKLFAIDYPQAANNAQIYPSLQNILSGDYVGLKLGGVDGNTGFAWFAGGINLAGLPATFWTPMPICKTLNLNNNTLNLSSDISLGSGIILNSNNGSISGNGHSIVLTGSVDFMPSVTISFSSDTCINAAGNDIDFYNGAILSVANPAILEIKNAHLLTCSGENIQAYGADKYIVLNDSMVDLVSTYSFGSNRLLIEGNVLIYAEEEDTAFNLNSGTITVFPGAVLTFDRNIRLKSLGGEISNMGTIVFDGSIIDFSSADLTLSGTVLMDNKVVLSGDGIGATTLDMHTAGIKVLGGARVEVTPYASIAV